MKNIIFILLTLLVCYCSLPANAKVKSQKKLIEPHQHEELWEIASEDRTSDIATVDPDRQVLPIDVTMYHQRAIAKSKLGDYRSAITDYTQAIDLIDANNLNAPAATVTVNTALSARIYNDRGLAKLMLGDKRGAIDDLTLAAELFDEVGLLDVSHRSMQIVKMLDN